MLAVGDPMPSAEVGLGPREHARLDELLEGGPVLFLFYLFDWSST